MTTSDSTPIGQLVALERDVPFAQPQRIALWRRLAAVVVAVALFIVLTELLSRTLIPVPISMNEYLYQRVQIAPGRLYQMRAGKTPGWDFEINSLGFRGGEYGPKPPNGIRIITLGDSTVFGYGSKDDETWPELIEKKVQEHTDRPVEVINLAVIAESSEGSRHNLYTYGDELGADMVVAAVGAWNDFQIFHENPALNDRQAIAQGIKHENIRKAHSVLHVFWWYRLIRYLHWPPIVKRDAEMTANWVKDGSFSYDAVDVPRRVPPAMFRENIAAICEWGRQRSVPVVFVTMRRRPKEHAEYPIGLRYSEAIRELTASGDGCHLVEGDQALTQLAERVGPEKVWWDEVHLFPLGNRALADAIAPVVLQLPPFAEGQSPQ